MLNRNFVLPLLALALASPARAEGRKIEEYDRGTFHGAAIATRDSLNPGTTATGAEVGARYDGQGDYGNGHLGASLGKVGDAVVGGFDMGIRANLYHFSDQELDGIHWMGAGATFRSSVQNHHLTLNALYQRHFRDGAGRMNVVVKPIGYHSDRATDVGGAYSGVGVGTEQSFLRGILTLHADAEAGVLYAMKRDNVTETTTEGENERTVTPTEDTTRRSDTVTTRLIHPELNQVGVGDYASARGGLQLNLGEKGWASLGITGIVDQQRFKTIEKFLDGSKSADPVSNNRTGATVMVHAAISTK